MNTLVWYQPQPVFVSCSENITFTTKPTKLMLFTFRYDLVMLLGLVLSQVLLGFRRRNPPWSGRNTVSSFQSKYRKWSWNWHRYRPANGAAIFITLIVKFPVIQILTALIAMFMVCLEFPAPFVKSYAVHRSIVVRIVVLTIQCTLAFLFYQVCLFFTIKC